MTKIIDGEDDPTLKNDTAPANQELASGEGKETSINGDSNNYKSVVEENTNDGDATGGNVSTNGDSNRAQGIDKEGRAYNYGKNISTNNIIEKNTQEYHT